MNRFMFRTCLAGALATGLATGFSPIAFAGNTQVTPEDQVGFIQKTIAAQMQELQDRMFRLAETTRQLEPDDSAKLILAVQRAREELIVEQMKDVMESLGRREMSKAADDQRQVLAKLETLKQLLLNSNLDLQSQLQQLRKIDAALKKIDAITKQQQAHRAQADAQAKLQTPEAPKLTALKQDQDATKTSTDTVAQTVQTLGEGAAGASKSLFGASSKMGSASKSLGSKPGDALASQDGALEDLKAARDQLEQQRQKIMLEVERQVRKQVIANLTDMLERQKGVREAEQSLASSAEGGDREAALSVRRLATAEQRIVTINDQTLELIKQTEFSLALPSALQDIGTRCVYLQSDLAAGKTGARVADASMQIEKDLASLIDTFKQLASANTTPSDCKGCKGDKNKLLAELKVLRLLQVRVNQETLDVDGQRAAAAELSPELRSKVTTARDHEEAAHAVADKIYQALSGN